VLLLPPKVLQRLASVLRSCLTGVEKERVDAAVAVAAVVVAAWLYL